jgi:hypothetical protein
MDTFKEHFSDADFYIGINYGSHLLVEPIIESYGLSTNITRLENEDLYCGSDASAYQLALKNLKQSSKKYDIYWFCHTKGSVNSRRYERSLYISELFSKRYDIELMFQNNSMLGSYGLRGVSSGAAGDQWMSFNNDHDIEICSNKKYDSLQYNHINWSYIETMYVIKKEAVESFLKLTTDKFYDEKIKDKCYFEISFPWIASRCGYFPYIKQNICFWGHKDLKNITEEWINENNLYNITHYLTL